MTFFWYYPGCCSNLEWGETSYKKRYSIYVPVPAPNLCSPDLHRQPQIAIFTRAYFSEAKRTKNGKSLASALIHISIQFVKEKSLKICAVHVANFHSWTSAVEWKFASMNRENPPPSIRTEKVKVGFAEFPPGRGKTFESRRGAFYSRRLTKFSVTWEGKMWENWSK